MKTPDEIKKDAETCMNHPHTYSCNSCRLYSECHGIAEHIIKELYDLVVSYETRLAQVERERDALMREVKDVGCALCRHVTSPMVYIRNECFDCVANCNFEWRGVCAENTKEDKNG